MNEVFSGVVGISSRGMFGGWGIYKDGVFFALIADGRLYFKVDDSNRADFENAGSEPFRYENKNKKSITMSYWELPAGVMDNPHELEQWVDKSICAKGKKG
ncbi:MAG: TfoX family protein [Candidatus Ryanbacteria bacterium]|nr:TfoX family protein [Candidatus Ryanbacteria bacterium]